MSLEIKSAQSGLPSDWEIKSIIELGNNKKNCVQTGPFGAQLHSSDYKNVGIPLLLIRNITDEGLDTNDLPKISPEDAERLKRYSLQINDIVFSRVGRVGSCFLVTPSEEGWIISGQLLRIRLEEDNVDYKYLYYYLRSKNVQEYLKGTSVGSTRESINTTILEQLKVAFPPIDEQQKIAKILSTVDEKIEVIEEQIAQTTELKKGVMQRLLTKGIGHTQFKDSPLGEIPESWEVRNFTEVTSLITCGVAARPEYVESGGIPFLSSKNVKENRIIWAGFNQITEEKHRELTKYNKPEKGDILYTRVGSFGDAAVIELEDEFSVFVSLTLIKPIRQVINSWFLSYLLNSEYYRNLAKSSTTGLGVQNLNVSAVRKFPIVVPDLEEQSRIAKILKTIDEKLNILECKKSENCVLKKGLMQQLLTGKLRVNHLIKSEVLV